MKYPITPSYIKNAPKPIEDLYRRLEDWILIDICQRFKFAGGATATALEHIRNLQRRGYRYDDIKKYIQATLKLTDAAFDKIMQQAILDNQRYYNSVLTEKTLVNSMFDNSMMSQEIDSIVANCKNNLENITKSLGFSVKTGGKVTYLPIAKTYQKVLNDAEMKVLSGAQSYNEAIRESVKELADSGIKTVTWSDDTGVYHADHADVAARRAVMTGITQLSGECSEQIRKEIPTEYMEITAHAGARDKDVKGRPWGNHKKWQGKVYSTVSDDKYPNVYEVCGLGEVDGLEGVNCRHLHFPFWDGISERTYTDQELANIDPPPFTYDGKTYNAYDASQRQRQIERTLRALKREMLAFDAIGDKDAYRQSALRFQALDSEYDKFCDAGGLRQQRDRANIPEFSPKDGRKARSIK